MNEITISIVWCIVWFVTIYTTLDVVFGMLQVLRFDRELLNWTIVEMFIASIAWAIIVVFWFN